MARGVFFIEQSFILILLGPILGSWFGVLTGTGGFLWRRSACAACGRRLTPAELLPILSFVALRGKCAGCGGAIGWEALAIELAALAVGIAVVAAGGGFADAALGWALLLAAWIDAKTFILPDWITLPLILAGLAVTALQAPENLTVNAAGAALGFLAFWAINEAYKRIRGRDGLGMGDAKLLGAGGAWTGVAALPDIVLAAGLLGLAAALLLRARWNGAIPFGPALAAAIFGVRLVASP
jgi:leader peptidase (prepilin peptidase)/N-methyltransferase